MTDFDLSMLNALDLFVRYVKITHTSDRTATFRDEENVLTLVTGGEGAMVINGVRYPLSRGDVVLMPPYYWHTLEIGPTQDLTEYIFHFDLFRRNSADRPDHVLLSSQFTFRTDHRSPDTTGCRRTLPAEEMLLEAFPRVIRMDSSKVEQLSKLIMEMQLEFIVQDAGFDCAMSSLAQLVLLSALRESNALPDQLIRSNRGLYMGGVQLAIRFIEIHYSEADLRLCDIARAAGYSTNYFSQIFKKTTGLSVYQYLSNVRVENAKIMLVLGSPLAEVAERCGFSSVYVFHKVFRRQTGMTPVEYLRSMPPK